MKEEPKLIRILIIDDNMVDREAIRRDIRNIYKDRAVEMDEAETGGAAYVMLMGKPYDCVFLDYLLPDMDGVSLLKKIYEPESDLGPHPVVMLTGQGSESVMLEALRWGAQDYIVKDKLTATTLNIATTKAREIFQLKRNRNRAEDQLAQVRRMEAVGQLTSGVAHDFNNLLTVVLGNSRLLKRRVLDTESEFSREDAAKKIDAIETAANKGADLVRRLMIFTRQSPLSQEVAELNPLIADITELLKRTLGETIEVETLMASDAWPVSIDVGEFDNMIINFAVNARDAMPRGGKLLIETANVMLDESYTFRHPDVAPGPYVMIAISDTGTGMDQDTMNRIFEPFFTTKPAGEGTGLGMSMAYGFVQQSRGHITVYSELGHGTVFRIYLPRVRVESDTEIWQEEESMPEGCETVLVAEDDDEVRATAVKMLEKLGYRTLQAKNGAIALEMLKKGHRDIDIVFTDIIMPGGMSGIELVRQMREYYPSIKALYTSGYSENAIPDYHLSVGEELLSKPYRRETLATKIRKILEARDN